MRSWLDRVRQERKCSPMLLLLVSGLGAAVRRLHDRNKSAWWILLFYLAPPAIQTIAWLNDLDSAVMVWLMVLSGALSLWALIELSCLPGTRGANRHGPDPLAPGRRTPELPAKKRRVDLREVAFARSELTRLGAQP